MTLLLTKETMPSKRSYNLPNEAIGRSSLKAWGCQIRTIQTHENVRNIEKRYSAQFGEKTYCRQYILWKRLIQKDTWAFGETVITDTCSGCSFPERLNRSTVPDTTRILRGCSSIARGVRFLWLVVCLLTKGSLSEWTKVQRTDWNENKNQRTAFRPMTNAFNLATIVRT